MKAQAIRPNFINFTPVVKDKAVEGKATDEERMLAALSTHAGWVILSNFIGELKQSMDNENAKAIAEGATFETIGQNTVVINMAKSVIDRILNKVSDAKELVEKLNE